MRVVLAAALAVLADALPHAYKRSADTREKNRELQDTTLERAESLDAELIRMQMAEFKRIQNIGNENIAKITERLIDLEESVVYIQQDMYSTDSMAHRLDAVEKTLKEVKAISNRAITVANRVDEETS